MPGSSGTPIAFIQWHVVNEMTTVPEHTERQRTDGEPPRDEEGTPLLFVVDDDVATLQLVRDVAEDAGWDARGFTRLHDLRVALDSRRPALIILDDDLPDGRGGDLARELGGDPRTTDVPLLVCTAAAPNRVAEIRSCAPVISKPFDLDDMERYFAAAARTYRGGDAPRRAAR